ncbi:MAG: hypothetical protein II179_03415 [Alphaproteobacteria bacterium]|nr:hypothetical protein [Alphaproteobacteria bacterium]
MNIRQKAMYLLSLAALPLGAYGCKKAPFPENDGYNNNPDTTINTQPNQPNLPSINEPNTDSNFNDTLRFSWLYDWTGPLNDHVKSYTDVGDFVVIVPDTTEQSIKGSCERLVGQWPDIYNRFMNFVAESAGHVKLSGVIYVPQIGDNLSNNVMGMDRNIADLFETLGITIKVKNAAGKTNNPKENTNEKMPLNTVSNMFKSKNTGYTIGWGFNHHFAGPCKDHVARRTTQYGGTHLVPDSTLWSKVQQGQFGKDDWDYIASQFTKYQNEYGATFEGNLYPFVGRMSPETKQNLENLGFHVIETVEKNDNRPAMPWNQAQQMLQNKSR